MRHEKYLIITDEYGLKHFEVYFTPCNLTVLSYDLGRALTLQETLEDEDLTQKINEYLYYRMEGGDMYEKLRAKYEAKGDKYG